MLRTHARAWMVGLSLAGGCRPESADSGDAERPTPWDYEAPRATPTRGAADLEPLLPGALQALLAVNIPRLLDVYDSVMAYGDRSCPYVAPVAHRYGWGDECTASSGARFEGRGAALHLVEEEGVHGHGDADLYLAITDPSGRTLEADGSTLWTDASEDGVRRFDGWVLGSFGYPTAGGWLASTRGVGLEVQSEDAGGGARWLSLDGGVELPSEGYSVQAAALRLHSPETGAGCSAEPSGTLTLRFDDGERYEVVFGGPEQADDTDWDCDGCGELRFGGEALGQVCLDPAPMLDWEGRPW